MRVFMTFVFAFLSHVVFSNAQAARDFTPDLSIAECRTTFLSATTKTDIVKTDLCQLPSGAETVSFTLTRTDSSKPPLTVRALFDKRARGRSASQPTPFWRRLWIAKGSPVITEHEQALIREGLAEIGLEAVEIRSLAVIDFVANFVEPNEAIPEFDASTEDLLFAEKRNTFTMICDLIGKLNVGQYTTYEKNVITSAIVGDPDTRCRGRCGIGCYQFSQWRKNQYTQECFEHDMCHFETGSMMGPCADSFWKAYHGYMNAPNCVK